MKFRIEQVALCPRDPAAAIDLLKAMGADDWVLDHVVAKGSVDGIQDQTNEADLAFNYEILSPAHELEVLHYTEGANWMDAHGPSVSHLGMHCTAEELEQWRAFFASRAIPVAQEVHTQSHTNEVIKDARRYNYVIFDTRHILGVDVKFIVRKDI